MKIFTNLAQRGTAQFTVSLSFGDTKQSVPYARLLPPPPHATQRLSQRPVSGMLDTMDHWPYIADFELLPVPYPPPNSGHDTRVFVARVKGQVVA